MRLAIIDDDEDVPTESTSLRDYLTANEETMSDDEIAALLKLALGESVRMPVHAGFITITRIE